MFYIHAVEFSQTIPQATYQQIKNIRQFSRSDLQVYFTAHSTDTSRTERNLHDPSASNVHWRRVHGTETERVVVFVVISVKHFSCSTASCTATRESTPPRTHYKHLDLLFQKPAQKKPLGLK